MKFLVDECLSPALTAVAHDAGHEAYHVVHRGWSGESDPRILQHLLAEELVLVTNNRDDFLALVQGMDVHPGLVVIVQNVRRAEQVRLFGLVLLAVGGDASLINRVVEVSEDGTITSYDLPNW